MLNNLPLINLEDFNADVDNILNSGTINFKGLDEAPWWLRRFSIMYGEFYFSYKNVIYVPEAHVSLATSKDPQTRLIATSKVLPWVFAIKNKSTSSFFKFLYTMFNTKIRNYYFLFEFSLLKSHDLKEIPELVATGFLSSRKNLLCMKKDPDKIVKSLKTLIRTKVKL